MNLYQINIYPEGKITEINFKVEAETKEDAEVVAKQTITALGLPAYPETPFERSFLKKVE